MNECLDHLEFINGTCEDCKLPVDEYGNTENQFDNCSFPHCGCDGARLCMAKYGASENSCKGNVEGMWSNGNKPECRKAAFYTIGLVNELNKKERSC